MQGCGSPILLRLTGVGERQKIDAWALLVDCLNGPDKCKGSASSRLRRLVGNPVSLLLRRQELLGGHETRGLVAFDMPG